jgi:hypothetical protein
LELVDGKGDGYFIGSIGEIRVWNRTLSAEEVSAAYNNGLFNTTGQVLYLPFSSQNHRPVADAGPDLTVNENQVILLNNSKGSDPDPEDTLIYKWTQIGGSPFVRLSNNNTATPVFNAPLDIPADTTFTLQFSVTDNHGLIDTDTMNVLAKNILPPTPTPPTLPTPPTPPPLAPPELEEEAEEEAEAKEEDAADEAEDAADEAEDAADEAEDAADEAEDAADEAEDEAVTVAAAEDAADEAEDEAVTVDAPEDENETVSVTDDEAILVTVAAAEDAADEAVAKSQDNGRLNRVTGLSDEEDIPAIENEPIAESRTKPMLEPEQAVLQEEVKEKEKIEELDDGSRNSDTTDNDIISFSSNNDDNKENDLVYDEDCGSDEVPASIYRTIECIREGECKSYEFDGKEVKHCNSR